MATTHNFKHRQAVKVNNTGRTGTVAAVIETPRGQWIEVNVGDKKKPVLQRYRPAALTRV